MILFEFKFSLFGLESTNVFFPNISFKCFQKLILHRKFQHDELWAKEENFFWKLCNSATETFKFNTKSHKLTCKKYVKSLNHRINQNCLVIEIKNCNSVLQYGRLIIDSKAPVKNTSFLELPKYCFPCFPVCQKKNFCSLEFLEYLKIPEEYDFVCLVFRSWLGNTYGVFYKYLRHTFFHKTFCFAAFCLSTFFSSFLQVFQKFYRIFPQFLEFSILKESFPLCFFRYYFVCYWKFDRKVVGWKKWKILALSNSSLEIIPLISISVDILKCG